MIKKFPVLLIAMALISSLAFAQNRNVVVEKMTVLSNQNQSVVSQQGYNSPALVPGTELFTTGYDYMCNNAIGPMVELFDLDGDGTLDPMMVGMQRMPDAAGQRTTRFSYISFGGLEDDFSAFDETAATSGSDTYGWGTLQYCAGGPLDGNVLMMAHSGGESYHTVIDLVNFTPVLPFPTVSFGGNFPSFTYQDDGTILASDTNADIFVSTDGGASFDSVAHVGDGDANVDLFAATGTPSEVPLYRSADGMNLAFVGTWAGAGLVGTPDIVYWYGSNDGGGTWAGLIPGVGSGSFPVYGQVVNRTYAPYFDNFGQINGNVDNTGVTHLALNGYGEGVLDGAVDTTNVFAIVYWNSANQEWISISDPLMDAPSDVDGNLITGGTTVRTYPGNGIGQAYPNISVSEDGRVVFVCWQAMEYTGAIGTSAWNMYPGDGGTETGVVYYTDLYYAFSEDGGATWSNVGILKGDTDVMEMYPYCARRIDYDGDMATVHYMYMEDAIPGIAVFNGQVAGQNSWSNDTKWLHETMTFQTTVGVDDEITVNSFSLDQNYPNPFNPSTQINYTLAERSSVTLKVFDVLGNEVVTLVNSTQEAGAYDINFDASQLSSGLYIYTINAGNFTSSKKMMLLK